MNINKSSLKISVLAIFSVFSSASAASGFAIIEQSITGLGRAFAGGAATAEDASTIFFNPAGMTELKTPELDIAATYVAPKANFTNQGSVTNLGQPLTGNEGGDGANNEFVPNMYYSQPVNNKVTVGLGINAPFGLVTEYNNTWVGRYHAVTSDLRTLNINPSFAVKANDKLSLGFGIDLQRISLVLSQMADLGAKYYFSPQSADGTAKITASDWSWGYNLGATYQVTPATRLGLAYRSKISHTLEGKGRLYTASDSLLAKDNIYGSVTLPETLSFAVNHKINSQWTVTGDATWTRWNRFQQLQIKSDNSASPFASTTEEKWHNTMRYGLGVIYAHNEKWTFRSGIAYDESPVPDASHRTARIPDKDRKWVAIGASYKATKNLSLDAGYAHLFAKASKINETDKNGYLLKGKYDVSVDLIGVQMRWQFQ